VGGLQVGGGFQGSVWNQVAWAQARLGASLNRAVEAKASPSSLQLTLEHPAVRKAVAGYTRKLLPLPAGKEDVVGCAFAINGEPSSAEVYAGPTLFRQLWPKLLTAAAVEALAERSPGPPPPPRLAALRPLLTGLDEGVVGVKQVGGRVEVVIQETERGLLFETWERRRSAWLHRSHVLK
jgi:hypothetical protein